MANEHNDTVVIQVQRKNSLSAQPSKQSSGSSSTKQPCSSNSQCPSPRACENGICTCPTMCSSSTQCCKGTACVNKKCIPDRPPIHPSSK